MSSGQERREKFKQVICKLHGEYEDFRETMLSSSKETIFDSYSKIFFYSNMFDFFIAGYNDVPENIADKLLQEPCGMEWLYAEYLEHEYSCVDCAEAINEFLYTLALECREDNHCYVACGDNVEEVTFTDLNAAEKYVEDHQYEGYDCVVESQPRIAYLSGEAN